jgi:ABC-type glycerol-3-phosphate transport system substrate-binding protein
VFLDDLATGRAISVRSGAPHQEGAGQAVLAVLSRAGQVALAEATGGVPVRSDIDPARVPEELRSSYESWRTAASVDSMASGTRLLPAARTALQTDLQEFLDGRQDVPRLRDGLVRAAGAAR